MRVLIVEDDLNTADFIVKGLREAGFTPDRAADGKEGLFLALEQAYDVIVLDRMLPGLDGLTLLKTVANMVRTRMTSFMWLSMLDRQMSCPS